MSVHRCDEPGCRKRFDTLQQLRTHAVSHETGECQVCHATFKRTGLGPHQAHCAKRAAKASAASLADKRLDRTLATLAALLMAGLGSETVDRCDLFLRSIREPAPGVRLLIVGPTFGPHLTSLANAGGVVMSAKEPVLVVDLALVVEPPVEKPASVTGRGW